MGESFSLTKAYFVAIFCEAIMHGIFTVLAGGALYLLLRKRKRHTSRTSPANIIMVLLIAIMYGLSTAHIALSLRVNIVAFFDQHALEGSPSIFDDQGNPIVYTQIALELINCILGDSIVCWRAWVIWGRSYRVILAPVVFIVSGTVAGVGLVRGFAQSPAGQQIYSDSILSWFLAYASLTCAANIYCLVAISWKAWTSIRSLRRVDKDVTIHGGTYYSVLLVIIESGILYSVAWVIMLILFAINNNGVYIMADTVAHLTGIYPTIIIVLVCLNMTFHDDLTRAEQTLSTMRYQARPAASTTLNEPSFRVGSSGRGGRTALGVNDDDDADAYMLEQLAYASTQASATDLLKDKENSGSRTRSEPTRKAEDLV